ncbi:MAG: phosphate ABC transporter permease PstA [Parvibaculaceae bacterium]
MTDVAATPSLPSAGAQARIARRYRAERRFRLYGIAAIAFAGIFLVVLLADILTKAWPAFTQTVLDLPVTVEASEVDPDGTKDPAVIAKGDFIAVVRNSLRAVFPDVTGRVPRRQLNGLLSVGAADELRNRVVADPALIGQEVREPLLLSDDADLYYKGYVTKIEEWSGGGDITPSATSGVIAFTVADGIIPKAPLGASQPSRLIALNGGLVKLISLEDGKVEGETLVPLASTATAGAGSWKLVTYETPEGSRRLSDQEVTWLEALKTKGLVESRFNFSFFTMGDSREAELAGILGALAGSALTMLVTLFLCLPVGVAAAIYLEEFAPKNRFTEIIEININNLAAVPSIVFGLLGLAVFLGFFGLPRSAPLVGGLVLALLVLPTIIIASRAALKAVPPSIREAALGVGASHQQAVFHHVLPLAMPGILTGTIIGMAHALGETAPLLLIGMVAFIVDPPSGFTSAATALPVQIYLWSDLPEIAFQAKTSAAIIVLLLFLFAMNGAAVLLRKRFERRW